LRTDRDTDNSPVISTNTWIWCQRNKSRNFAQLILLICCCWFFYFVPFFIFTLTYFIFSYFSSFCLVFLILLLLFSYLYSYSLYFLSFSCATIHCSPLTHIIFSPCFSFILSPWLYLPLFAFPYLSPHYSSFLHVYHLLISLLYNPTHHHHSAFPDTRNIYYNWTTLYTRALKPYSSHTSSPFTLSLLFCPYFKCQLCKLPKYLSLSKQTLPPIPTVYI
jgi:hypothetical protein